MNHPSFDEVWGELTEGLLSLPPCDVCDEYPQDPCIKTLGVPSVRNHIVNVSYRGVTRLSHRSKKRKNSTIFKERFAETWDALSEKGTIPFRTGNHGSFVGAVFVQCLPRLVRMSGKDNIKLLDH